MLAACMDHESAIDFGKKGVKKGGAFTNALITAMVGALVCLRDGNFQSHRKVSGKPSDTHVACRLHDGVFKHVTLCE